MLPCPSCLRCWTTWDTASKGLAASNHISLGETHSFSLSVETKAKFFFPSNMSFYLNFEVKSIFEIYMLNQSNSIYNQV